MEFIKVESANTELIEKVYSILAAAGAYMMEKFGLMHWAKPYPIERIEEDTKNKQVYIVKSDDAFVATFALSDNTIPAFESIPDESAVYLSKFAVNPSIINSGVGSTCIKYIEDMCKERNKTKVRLDVYNKSKHAIKFYIKMGYKELSLKPYNVICMEKVI